MFKWWVEFQKMMVIEGIKTVLIIVSVLLAMQMYMPTLMEQAHQTLLEETRQAVKMCEKDKGDGS